MTRPPFSRRLTALAAVGVLTAGLGVAAGGAAQAAPSSPNTDAAAAASGVDQSSVIVRLSQEPLATNPAVARGAKGKVDREAPATRNIKAQLAQQRNALRAWLRSNAPKAHITGEYDAALNGVAVRLNGTPVDVLKRAPGVAEVAYQATYHPTATDDPDLALIDALEGWTAADASTKETDPTTWAGYGVKVGIIDTGIDATHPCFSDAGYASVKQVGDTQYTNNKVIAARVFNNKLNQNGFDAKAVQDHGTHVAGTVACNLTTPANVEGADIPYDPSGVAPGALLGNYSVFPGDVQSARTEDIANAMQAAFDDGMDVINMSLGGDSHGVQDLGTTMVDNLDRAGMVVAVSAGNEGPGGYTAGSPGMAERALTAGASSVGHFVGLPISAAGTQVTVGAIGDFATPEADLTAPLAVVKDGDALSQACSPITADFTGSIALVSRGTCAFGQKIQAAQNAGAVGVIVVNNVPGDPSAMGSDGVNNPTIPAVMASLADRDALMGLGGELVTLGATKAYKDTDNDNILMSFSSWGPTDVANRVKPDVVAPGGNVLSSLPQASCESAPTEGCWGLMSGTSMAAPHLAGMAAVVLDAHPDWQPWQVRSAIVNTAKVDGVIASNLSGVERDVTRVGSGLADLDAAVDASLVLSRPSLAFGSVPLRSGKPLSQSVEVTNVSGGPVTVTPKVKDAVKGSFTVTGGGELAAGESTTVTVTFKPTAKGLAQAHLWLDDTTHAVLFGHVK